VRDSDCLLLSRAPVLQCLHLWYVRFHGSRQPGYVSTTLSVLREVRPHGFSPLSTSSQHRVHLLNALGHLAWPVTGAGHSVSKLLLPYSREEGEKMVGRHSTDFRGQKVAVPLGMSRRRFGAKFWVCTECCAILLCEYHALRGHVHVRVSVVNYGEKCCFLAPNDLPPLHTFSCHHNLGPRPSSILLHIPALVAHVRSKHHLPLTERSRVSQGQQWGCAGSVLLFRCWTMWVPHGGLFKCSTDEFWVKWCGWWQVKVGGQNWVLGSSALSLLSSSGTCHQSLQSSTSWKHCHVHVLRTLRMWQKWAPSISGVKMSRDKPTTVILYYGCILFLITSSATCRCSATWLFLHNHSTNHL
jgi:hypothetical protein